MIVLFNVYLNCGLIDCGLYVILFERAWLNLIHDMGRNYHDILILYMYFIMEYEELN